MRLSALGTVHHHQRPLLVAIADIAGYVLTSYLPVYLETRIGHPASAAMVTVLGAGLGLFHREKQGRCIRNSDAAPLLFRSVLRVGFSPSSR